ncbi:GTPase HflX [Candidatus Bathyarchaeota archaeon]|nr:MAG: GTPase HflX [Candidatus Bathyarchaeota archaeon]
MLIQRRERDEPCSLDELRSLAESAGYVVVGTVEQVRKPHPKYQIGSGKVREIANLVREKNVERLIFDNPLKPVQAYNLAKATGVEAIDRFQLILEIFAKRASTTEAKLQIQLAKLKYELAHAKEKVRLAKKGEQPGFMGLGAYEVDVYYETVKREIHTIQRKLRKIRKKRSLHRARRMELGFPTVSLAGYTNAGKSSLFNALAQETVQVDNGLFTTLSTTTRLTNFCGKKMLLTDTVGFINRLPITLIEAFHSTLEETIFSDLILLVVDASEPIQTIENKLSCCFETIETIGASGIPLITALNKIDLLTKENLQQKLESLGDLAPNPVPISALYAVNLDLLKEEVARHIKAYVQASFSIPLNDETMSFLSWLHMRTHVQSLKYDGDAANVVFEAVPPFANKVRKYVEEHDGAFKVING